MATINRTTQIFRDFDLAFSSHPNTKDIAVKRDGEAVKQSVKNLILTQYYERPFHSEIGSPVRSLLFDLATPLTANSMKRGIIDVIESYEPRVRLLDVNVNLQDENNACEISITYNIVGFQTVEDLTFALERTR
jgi:phage baseplate assembly protein W